MNAIELAAKINGREYNDDDITKFWTLLTNEEDAEAANAGLVVVYGEDELMVQFRGAIKGEAFAQNGDNIFIDKDGILKTWGDIKDSSIIEEDARKWFDRKDKANKITAIYGSDGYQWRFVTGITVATFDILKDGNKFCRGIIFSIDVL